MKKEWLVTGVFVAVAVVLGLIVTFATGDADTKTGDYIGKKFFPDFNEIDQCNSLEVIKFYENVAMGERVVIERVKGSDGKVGLLITSNDNYPVDDAEKLSEVLQAIIGLKKGRIVTENPADYEKYGVVDIKEKSAEQKGNLRGLVSSISVYNEKGETVADYIVGKTPEGKEDFRYVRIPGEKPVYEVEMDLKLTTKFKDWVDTELIGESENKIQSVEFDIYSIDEELFGTGNELKTVDEFQLKRKTDGWSLLNEKNESIIPKGKKIDGDVVESVLSAINNMKIVGADKKPESLISVLNNGLENAYLTEEDKSFLKGCGFYMVVHEKKPFYFSNEGVVTINTSTGIYYILRFGEIAVSSSESLNRILFIEAKFNESLIPSISPPVSGKENPTEEDKIKEAEETKAFLAKLDDQKKEIEETKKKCLELQKKYLNWFYVISETEYKKLHLTRKDLIKGN